MKSCRTLPLSIAAISLAVLLPASALPAFAQTDQSNSSQMNSQMNSQTNSQVNSQQDQNSGHMRGMREAMLMVPARATLDRTLVADKDQPGEIFRAKLAHKVQLQNGPELPTGTVLVGHVVTDNMNEAGTSKLALRFTEAKLRDGQTVPIKATIVGVVGPSVTDAEDYPVTDGDQEPNNWNHNTLAIDQIGAMSGVDLHSKIANSNSGVFVSTTKDNMKLKAGSELELAIAQQQPMNAMNDNNGMNNNSSNGTNNNMNNTNNSGGQQ